MRTPAHPTVKGIEKEYAIHENILFGIRDDVPLHPTVYGRKQQGAIGRAGIILSNRPSPLGIKKKHIKNWMIHVALLE
jgi:hypothetical protein